MSQMSPIAGGSAFPLYPTASMSAGEPGANADSDDTAANGTALAPLDIERALSGGPLRVLVIAAEAVPYVKTGGPADVIGALPRALRRLGHDVRVVAAALQELDPERWRLHPVVDDLSVPMSHTCELVSVMNTAQDEPVRSTSSTRRTTSSARSSTATTTTANASSCSAAPRWNSSARSTGRRTSSTATTGIPPSCPTGSRPLYRDDPVLRRHRDGLHHPQSGRTRASLAIASWRWPASREEGFLYAEVPELANVVDLMGRGILFADVVSTVSPRYAREILTPEFGERLDSAAARAQRSPLRHPQRHRYRRNTTPRPISPSPRTTTPSAWSSAPRTKRALQRRCDLPVEARTPLIGIISRLTDQKGFDLLDRR